MTLFKLALALMASAAVLADNDTTHSLKGSTIQYPVAINGINLLSASAHELSQALALGTISSVDLVNAYLQRIEANNHQGLNLRALIETSPQAQAEAAMYDAERAGGKVRSALHGIPIAVKDNYNTEPSLGMNTTAGGYALLDQTVVGDAFVIKRLRDAGVIILGKANLDEYAGMKGASNSSGWSARGGQTSSAYVDGGFAAGGDPGGSSGGSAVAASAGFAAFALGSDTEGSIINPSSRAALFGLRPSTGLTSRTGVVPISSSQDTTGPMAKSTWDVAAALEIMAAHDPDDTYSSAAEPYRKINYTQYINPNGLQGLRIGVPRDPYWNSTNTGLSGEYYMKIDEIVASLNSTGATVIDPIEFPDPSALVYGFPGYHIRWNNATTVLHYDFEADMSDYLENQLVNSTLSSLYDIAAFNDANADLEFPTGHCCQTTMIAAQQTRDREHSAEYWLAKFHQQSIYVEQIATVYRQYDLDLLVLPTEANAARLGAISHAPVGNVPAGYSSINLPFGMSFVGKPYDEPTVLRAMSGYEADFARRLVPSTLD